MSSLSTYDDTAHRVLDVYEYPLNKEKFFLLSNQDNYNTDPLDLQVDLDNNTYNVNGEIYGDYDPIKLDMVNKQIENIEDNYYGIGLMSSISSSEIIEGTNGYVGDVELITKNLLPGIQETLEYDNNETSIKGILEPNALNNIFFSDMNIKVINDAIRHGVYQRTNNVIDKQSGNELYIVMRSIMLQYANFQATSENIIDEIQRLNIKVILYCVDNISSNVSQQIGYIEKIKNLPVPMDRPSYVEHPRNFTYDISNLL